MAYLDFPNVSLKEVSACIPKAIIENKNLDIFKTEDFSKFLTLTGVERKRVAGDDICTSYLCYYSAEKLLTDQDWGKSDIDCIIFVSQTPDYVLPATSCLLQERLGLKSEVVSLDISSGCSAWIYGLSIISAMLSSGNLKCRLLLVGDTILKSCSREDKSTFPLFGDAGTSTAIEFKKGANGLRFHLVCDGSGFNSIIIPDGGYRNCVSDSSFEIKEYEPGIKRDNTQLAMDGINVFSFGMKRAPESVNLLMSHFNISHEKIDYFIFHQANKFLNENISKKLNLSEEKVPYSLKDFGNTSAASIPLILLSKSKDLEHSQKEIIACGFGVGLSWGSVNLTIDKLVCSALIEL